ncbi:MAG: LysR family transcriptional regulator [Lachnospiraceae bacterium]|nr:LysR family transcriptional regulator [Lachnospiraceae bacterium]
MAKYHSFNKAATVLFNSQPNINRAINNLEIELGCKLFNRSHSGVTLTEEGTALFQYVEVAHKQLELGEALLDSRKALKHGNVTIGLSIGITEGLLNKMILPKINDFHQSFPDIHLQIVNDSTPHLVSNVAEGPLDLAVITALPQDKKSSRRKLVEVPIHSFHDIVIAGKSYEKFKNKVSLQELAEYPLISLWHETETYEFYKNYYARYGLDYSPSIETATTNQIFSFAAYGMGYGFISPEYAEYALADKSVIRIHLTEPLPIRNIVLIHREETAISIAAARLKEFVLSTGLSS